MVAAEGASRLPLSIDAVCPIDNSANSSTPAHDRPRFSLAHLTRSPIFSMGPFMHDDLDFVNDERNRRRAFFFV